MSARGTWRERNPEAYNAAWRRWYRENAARKIEWQARRRNELREWWADWKSSKRCETCGESAPECLHLHHLDPASKEITLADAIAQGWSKPRILEEVGKCRVLCANCHFKHHWDADQQK